MSAEPDMAKEEQSPAKSRGEGRVLFASGGGGPETCDLPLQLSASGYAVETVGIEEARWLWPLEGYDVLLVDATEQPVGALELCRHVKNSSSEQRVMLLFGDRTGAVPHRFHADAVLSGTPTPDQFLAVVRLLLAAKPASVTPIRTWPRPAPAEEPAQERRAS